MVFYCSHISGYLSEGNMHFYTINIYAQRVPVTFGGDREIQIMPSRQNLTEGSY